MGALSNRVTSIVARGKRASNVDVDVIETSGLHKRFGKREVLHGIDLRVSSGSLYGFLGPNGAGKTTTIRILLGLLRPTCGAAHVLGQDAWHNGAKTRAAVGYLQGDPRWYPHLTGAETLAFLGRARRRASHERIGALASRFELELDQKVRTYSRGMKQKLGLIQALMHAPEVIILDEPTTALDPLMQEVLHSELRRVTTEGATVLLSSHTLSEVARLCDHVGILRNGRLIEQTSMQALRERAVRRIALVFTDAAPAEVPACLRIAQRSAREITGSWSGTPDALFAWLSRQRIADVNIAPPDLEDLFSAYYRTDSREASP